MAGKTRAYAARVDIDAPAERVWAALTGAEALTKWLSPAARMALQAGGFFNGSLDRVRSFSARVDVFDPPRRIRLVHLKPQELPALEAVIVDDILVERRDEGTILRVLGSGFPREPEFGDFYMRRQLGWRRALARLKVYLEKGMDLGPARKEHS
jgi:uncharacterized protein YndB with AHSA1/START domain